MSKEVLNPAYYINRWKETAVSNIAGTVAT